MSLQRNKQVYRGYEIGTESDEGVYYSSVYRGFIKSKKSKDVYYDDNGYPTPESALREIKVVVDEFIKKESKLEVKHRISKKKLKKPTIWVPKLFDFSMFHGYRGN